MGILDTIITTNQRESMQEFELGLIVSKILDPLKDREKVILTKRYGLQGQEAQTLKAVGEEQGLTRERVRQIEKELLKNLKVAVQQLESFVDARDVLVATIAEHGGIMSEAHLMSHLGIETEEEMNAIKFLLSLIVELESHDADDHIRQSWTRLGFDKNLLKQFLKETVVLFENHGQPLDPDAFIGKFKTTAFYKTHKNTFSEGVLLNFLHTSSHIHKNPFGEYGLHHWNEIKPKDVGDKAYVVMKHHGKPEHYGAITELINKHGLDKRTAYKETVHNKLIKDTRFVLVGRGMYALSEWGYKPGVVSDIIIEVLKDSNEPMTRDGIIEAVMKRRIVKKNTILVGLSNRTLFKKVSKNLYALA